MSWLKRRKPRPAPRPPQTVLERELERIRLGTFRRRRGKQIPRYKAGGVSDMLRRLKAGDVFWLEEHATTRARINETARQHGVNVEVERFAALPTDRERRLVIDQPGRYVLRVRILKVEQDDAPEGAAKSGPPNPWGARPPRPRSPPR